MDAGAGGTVYGRAIYNGLGQVIQTQGEYDGSSVEVFQDVSYASSGWKAATSVPYTTTLPQQNGMYWKLPDTGQAKTQYAYDALGRVLTQTNTDGSTVQTAYQDWKMVALDENQHEKITEKDAYGRVSVVTEITGTNASPTFDGDFYDKAVYTYDILGNLTQVDQTDNASHYTSTMTYDRAGRKVRMDDTDMGTWRYWYDLAGNLTTQKDARPSGSTVICSYYDLANRLTGKEYRGDTTCSGSPISITYSYDSGTNGKGQRTGMSDGLSGYANWTYDNRGRMIEETKAITGVTGSPFTTQWTYNSLDKVKTTVYPDGETVTTGYTVFGQPNSLSGSSGPTTYVGDTLYTAWGALDLLKLGPSGSPKITVDYIYHAWETSSGRGRLQQISDSLQDLRYTYDAVGNVTKIDDYKAGNPQTQNFSYDALNRLMTAEAVNGANGAYSQENYLYNFAGNITSKAGQSYTYSD